jgi:pimeloyl-ACP methyl ester carboxylesterase
MPNPDHAPPVSTEILARADGATIAYRRRPAEGSGRALPGVVFLGGFASDMNGTKAAAIDRFCADRGQAFLRFDYFGHGESSGTFADGTIGRWSEDALCVLDSLTEGRQILVGSSMGGWIMLNVALARPQRIAALIGIAAAPDFTEIIWSGLGEAGRAQLLANGKVFLPSGYSAAPYPITRALIEEGRTHLRLGAPLPIACPVKLMQGMRDPDVPWRTALRIAEQLAAEDVQVTLVKDGDHRLSRDQDLDLLFRMLARLSGTLRDPGDSRDAEA